MKKSIKTPWYEFYDGVKPHLEYPNISLYNLLEKTAKEHLSNISYNYYGTKKTYKQFLKQIDKCAKAFKQLGVKENSAVSICMPNTPEAIISFYALNKIGAVANMIHPLSSEEEIKYYVNLTKSKYIITIDVSFNKINHIFGETKLNNIILVSPGNSMPYYLKVAYNLTKGRKLCLESNNSTIVWNDFIKLGKKYKEDIDSNYDGDKTACILYSGGTTGFPKGIELSNRNFNALAIQSFESCHCLKSKDKALAVMPIFHGFGLGVCIHTIQYFGGTSILLPTFSAKTFDKLLKKYKPNVLVGVPTLFEALLINEGFKGMNLSYLKCVISGGDTLSISLKRKIDNFLHEHGANIQVREGYGLTECSSASCLTPEKIFREGSIGLPFPDTYYKIVKPKTLKELKYGEEGELVICGPTVMKGYLNNEEETKNTLSKDKDGNIWLHTGDICYMDKDGFVYYKHRLKRMIVSSGYNIYPTYIENILETHPNVLKSCVIGIPHPYKHEVAKAFIVLNKKVDDVEKEIKDIRKFCESKLAKFSWPYEYEIRKELPKTLVGKVAYTKLMKEEKKKNNNK